MHPLTETHLAVIRMALGEARQFYKAAHFRQEGGDTPAELLVKIKGALFNERLDESIAHQPDRERCPEQLRANFLTLRKAIETARIIYQRHAEEPRTESDILILDMIGLFIHNSAVDKAAGFEELFEWIGEEPDLE